MGIPYARFDNWEGTTRYFKNKSYTARLQYLFRLIIGSFKGFAESLTSLDKYDGTGISSIGDSVCIQIGLSMHAEVAAYMLQ
jgi:hypothetical protein